MIHFFATLPDQLLNVVRDVNPGWYLLAGVLVIGATAVYLIATAP